MLCLDKLSVGYVGPRGTVLADLTLEAPAGSFVCVLGRNGAGKSTLMWTIAGLQAARDGRALLGNEDSDAAIEMTMIGGTYRFLADSRVCLTGAHAHHATISIGEQQQPVPHQHVVQVPRGSVISIGPLLQGVRAYLCVSGGIQTPPCCTTIPISLNCSGTAFT